MRAETKTQQENNQSGNCKGLFRKTVVGAAAWKVLHRVVVVELVDDTDDADSTDEEDVMVQYKIDIKICVYL